MPAPAGAGERPSVAPWRRCAPGSRIPQRVKFTAFRSDSFRESSVFLLLGERRPTHGHTVGGRVGPVGVASGALSAAVGVGCQLELGSRVFQRAE
ncbi:hypothetical protein GCM10022227_07320 [Streptomyces sedi]